MKTEVDIRAEKIMSRSGAPEGSASATRAPFGEADMVPESRTRAVPVVLSFDVEEHHRIEAAAGLEVDPGLKKDYGHRMGHATAWILEQLASRGIHGTFFIVGQIAKTDPDLIRSICRAGHEVASHGWDHRRIHVMTPEALREDVRTSKDALEQASGEAVFGYRAPTFSVVRETAWALDILVEQGLLYDSSIYPVHHDRYGIANAPRGPFLAQGSKHEILEIPPATLRLGGFNVPVGGGGYFRLLPYSLMRLALSLSRRDPHAGATLLYFHPWEFDPDQPRLPLGRIDSFRTYVGVRHTRYRLSRLLPAYSFTRGVDLAWELQAHRERLPTFSPAT